MQVYFTQLNAICGHDAYITLNIICQGNLNAQPLLSQDLLLASPDGLWQAAPQHSIALPAVRCAKGSSLLPIHLLAVLLTVGFTNNCSTSATGSSFIFQANDRSSCSSPHSAS